MFAAAEGAVAELALVLLLGLAGLADGGGRRRRGHGGGHGSGLAVQRRGERDGRGRRRQSGGRAGAERRCSDAAKGARRPGALKRDGGCGEAGESVFHSAKFAMRRAGQRRGGRGETEAGTERRRHLREEYKESRAEARGPPRPRQGRHDGRRGPVRSTHTCPLSLSGWTAPQARTGTGPLAALALAATTRAASTPSRPATHQPASTHHPPTIPPVAGEG
jgi:hypothetical protein